MNTQAPEFASNPAAAITVDAQRRERVKSFYRTVLCVLIGGVCYYLATELAWNLCLSHTQVSLFFPPYAVLASILLLVPTRLWWGYLLAATGGHFVAAYEAEWPLSFAVYSEILDGLRSILAAAGLRLLIRPPQERPNLRNAVAFVLIAVVIVPAGTALLGAALTLSYHYGTHFWAEWRKLGISNGVTAIVLVPAILLGAHHLSGRRLKASRAKLFEAGLLGAGLLVVGFSVFGSLPSGPETSPALLYAPIPFLIWAALRFGVGGTCASMLIITMLAIGGMMRGRGPFLGQAPADDALALQLFLLVTAIPLLFLAVVIDEERHSRSALSESEARFRSVANTAPVMIWVTGTDKLCTFVSKGWLDFTGRTLEQELDKGWAESLHREDHDRCLAIYENSFDARKPFEMEYRLHRKDGEYRQVLDIGTPRYSEDGAFLGYIGSCIDVSALKLAEEAAHQLTGHLIYAQEETRKELARELHDDFCQSLAFLAIQLDIFRRNPPVEPIVIAAQMEELSAQVKRMASGVHELSHELHPAKLDQLGLAAAMGGFCKEFAQVHKMAIEFVERDVPQILPDDTALCLYRIAQEALHNVLKHSHGCEAKCELAGHEGHLRLTITDDGAGFDPQVARTKGSLGLISMSERARFVGGHLNVESCPGVGTRIEVRVPIAGTRGALARESEMEGFASR